MASPPSTALPHFDGEGRARMVDVAGKAETHRVARSTGTIRMKPETLALIASGTSRKGDVLGVARVAAIAGAADALRGGTLPAASTVVVSTGPAS